MILSTLKTRLVQCLWLNSQMIFDCFYTSSGSEANYCFVILEYWFAWMDELETGYLFACASQKILRVALDMLDDLISSRCQYAFEQKFSYTLINLTPEDIQTHSSKIIACHSMLKPKEV